MMTKFTYMRIVSLFLVILGFGYSITSFSNFYAYLYGDIIIANANTLVMCVGLLFPLYMFIFGVFFYLYTDKDFSRINPIVLISGIGMSIAGIIRLIIASGIMEFIHISFAYVLIILGLALVYGCIRYKY